MQIFLHNTWIIFTAAVIASAVLAWWSLRQVFYNLQLTRRIGYAFLGWSFEVMCAEIAVCVFASNSIGNLLLRDIGRLVEVISLGQLIIYLLTLRKDRDVRDVR